LKKIGVNGKILEIKELLGKLGNIREIVEIWGNYGIIGNLR
jgi:hypothetical protein